MMYLDGVFAVFVTLLLVRILPTRWFSKEENIRYSSNKRLKSKLRKR